MTKKKKKDSTPFPKLSGVPRGQHNLSSCMCPAPSATMPGQLPSIAPVSTGISIRFKDSVRLIHRESGSSRR